MSKFIDLTGQKFSRLTVMSRAYVPNKKRTYWNVVCDCGVEMIVEASKLKSGHTKSCGCYRKEFQRTDISGKRYGRLIVLGYSHFEESSQASKWLVRCDCGKEKAVRKHALESGLTQSCGCLHSEIVKRSDNKHIIHGLSFTKIHRTWSNMKSRCDNSNVSSYKYYGAKGVKYNKHWEKFENFLKDMGESFDKHIEEYGHKNTSLDRIDPYGDYKPDNYRWATLKQQANNKRMKTLTS